MCTETAAVAEISEQPGDRQHADQRYQSDNADRNVALSDRQCIRPAGFSRARCSNRTSESSGHGFNKFEKGPNRRNANRASADEADLCAPGFLRERRGSCRKITGHRRKMRNAPAPSDQRAEKHRDPDGLTDQMSDPEKRKRQKEIISAHCSALANPKSLR